MSNASLTVKPIAGDGTTDYVDGNYLPAAELQADFDAIINVVNGNLDQDNLHSSTQIPNSKLVDIAMSKVLDLADDIATYITTTSPGDTGTPSLPTTLAAEMQRLRHRLGALRTYSTNVYYMNSSAVATAAGWFEPPPIGRNLLPNPGFELQSGAANSAPDGWALYSTPVTVAIENPAHTSTGLEKRSLNIVTDGANEGISCTVAGLKASTKYLIGMAYSITDNGTVAGTVGLYTGNGLATGDYRNLAITSSTESASTVVVTNGIVKSTSTPDPITVRIVATTAGADFNVHSVWMYEMGESYPDELPAIPTQSATDNTSVTIPSTFTSGQWNYEARSELALSAYIPAQGYRMTYEVQLSILSSGTGNNVHKHAFQIKLDGNIVEGPFIKYTEYSSGTPEIGDVVTLRHVVDNPTPGSTYAFTVEIGARNDGSASSQITLNPSINSLQSVSRARLVVERM